jgi:hypothetical protein
MKLFLVTAVCDDGDYSELVVAENDLTAKEKIVGILQHYGEIVYVATAREVSEVDGYKIALIKEERR